MKHVLVNGGSRGIGAACVRKFAKEGYAVSFTYYNSESDAQILADETGAFPIRANNEDMDEIVGAVKLAREYMGEIDILINNAAHSSFSMMNDLSLEEWEKTIRINLTAPFLFMKETMQDMIHNKAGRIINIASMWGETGASCESHYAASKGGLIALSKSMAKELGPSGITVNVVSPGVVNTAMNHTLTDEDMDVLKADTPLQRIAEPHEIADTIFFLASDEASFITGDVLRVNGGYII